MNSIAEISRSNALTVGQSRWLIAPVPKVASTLLKRLGVIADGREPLPHNHPAFGGDLPDAERADLFCRRIAQFGELFPEPAPEALRGRRGNDENENLLEEVELAVKAMMYPGLSFEAGLPAMRALRCGDNLRVVTVHLL